MKRVIIIAEAGVNHNGDMERARELINVAAEAGVDYVKFQSFKASKLVSPEARKADYQSRNMEGGDDRQFEMLKQLELSDEQHLMLIDYCRKKNIKFLSTAFDAEGVSYLNGLGLDLMKSPSGEITNYPYLKALAQTPKSLVLSTGMADLNEIKMALNTLENLGMPRTMITVLHCNTEYPTPMEDVNLKAMNTIGRECGVAIGYSDHTLGIEVPIAAVALGATVIEKHFTLDRALPGPDHRASLEPDELKAMVSAIRNIEKAIGGDGIKKPSPSELKNKAIARKSLHTARPLSSGTVLTEEDLIPLRPGDGISPMQWEQVIGKTMQHDTEAFEILRESDFQ